MRKNAFFTSAFVLAALLTASAAQAQTTTSSGTVQELGPFIYYNFYSSDGTVTTGTSHKLGNFEFYNLTTAGTEAGHYRGSARLHSPEGGGRCSSESFLGS